MTTTKIDPLRQGQWLCLAVNKLLIGGMIAFVAASAGAADSVSTTAGAEGPAQTAYAPPQPGPVVIVLSGVSGPPLYQSYAAEVAKLGYYSVLLDGKDVLTREQDGTANLKKAIERAQKSPHAVPGKTAVIGFSQGGGGAILHAVTLPDISMIVMYYPSVSWAKDPGALAKRFRVPVLILAGERDRYNNNCCPVESMRAIEAVAKQSEAKFELVVYPQADHGFNLKGPTFRSDDTSDAWRRTTEMLRLHHPLK